VLPFSSREATRIGGQPFPDGTKCRTWCTSVPEVFATPYGAAAGEHAMTGGRGPVLRILSVKPQPRALLELGDRSYGSLRS
jgi:hypothetical protein